MKTTRRVLSKAKESLSTIIIVTGIISTLISFGWCKLAVPEVKKIAKEENAPTVKILEQLLEETEFQNYLIMSDRSVQEIDSARVRWKQFKIEKRR